MYIKFDKNNLLFFEEKDNFQILKAITINPYLATFKHIQLNIDKLKEEITHIILVMSNKKVYNLVVFEELKKITNYCIYKIGLDIKKIGNYTQNDIEEIKIGKWKGRTWIIQNGYVHLNICNNTNLLYLDFCFNLN